MNQRISPRHHPVRRRTVFFALAALLLAACGAEAPDQASLLNRGTFSEPESLDMHKARTLQAGDVQRDLGEGLMAFGPDGNYILAAAEGVELSDDSLTYTFALRPENRWSNGEPVTAHDFVYSYRRLVDPATAAYYGELTLGAVVNAADIIAGRKPADSLAVDAVNDLTLQITLSHPVPYFLKLLTHPCTFPVHRASVEQYGDRHAQPGNLVTNGAYRLVDWKIGSYIELVRNEHYRNNAQTAIDRVRHHVTSDSLAELNRYRAGELHITASIPAESFQQMLRERPDEVRVSPYNAVYYYGLNMTRPPFKDNPKLRQALSMAIDRETITEKVIGRGEMPAYSWVPPGVSNYDPQQLRYAGMSRQEQIARARELYSEAGYGPDNPLRIELRHITADSHKRIAEAVQFMWQEALGVETTTIIEEFQVLLEHMRKKEITQVFVSGWTGDYDDANAFLEILQSRNLSNMSGYSNPEYDRQMQRAAKQTDMRVRQGYLEEAEAILLDDHPIIPIYFLVNKNMVSPRVRGWQDNILNYHYSQYLSLADSN